MRIDELYIRDEQIELLKELSTGATAAQAGKKLFRAKRTIEKQKEKLFKMFSIKGRRGKTIRLLNAVKAKGIILLFIIFSISYVKSQTLPFCSPTLAGGRFHFAWLGDSAPVWPTGWQAYRLKLFLYYQAVNGFYDIPDHVIIKVWDNDTDSVWIVKNQPIEWVHDVPEDTANAVYCQHPPLRYKVALFAATVDLAPNQYGYFAAYQTGCQ